MHPKWATIWTTTIKLIDNASGTNINIWDQVKKSTNKSENLSGLDPPTTMN